MGVGGKEVAMAKVFVMSSNGSENPTKASLALLMAKAAVGGDMKSRWPSSETPL
jgi:hypothetical protein